MTIGEPEDRASNRVLIPPMTDAPERPPGDVVWSLTGETMGTEWFVRAAPPPNTNRDEIAAAVQAELDAVVGLFSPWVRSSEISRFNTAPAGLWAVSPEFWSLVDQSMDLADETNGAVDPTLGALVDLWGFGPPGLRPETGPLIPTDEEIAAAMAVSGWHKLRMHRDGRGLMQMGGMKLDLSGIAKGYAVDRVSDRLTALGLTSHLVEIGGELKGRGVKPDGQPWWVEIERSPDSDQPRTVAALFDIAVATSGDYRRAFEVDGKLYPHSIDGWTGRPIDNGVTSVTVFHESAMKADAYATALTVMGAAEGADYAAAIGLAAHIVERTPEGPVERMTTAFAAMMQEGEEPA